MPFDASWTNKKSQQVQMLSFHTIVAQLLTNE